MTAEPWVIRAARPADASAIDAVVRAAFAASTMGHQGEAELVRALEEDGDALLSLVAEADGAVIGHALFSRMTVEADGASWRAAGLGPVAVLPGAQSSGVGSALIRAGLDQLADAGTQISFVLGHPVYYPRFGYSAEAAAPFASPYAGPHFMALLLDKALQIPKSGRADYAAAFSR
jgi:putative acetyltransferase